MAKYKAMLAVAENAVTRTVTHNLNDVNAVVTKVTPNWAVSPYYSTKTANEVVINFTVPAPASPSAMIDVVVETV